MQVVRKFKNDENIKDLISFDNYIISSGKGLSIWDIRNER